MLLYLPCSFNRKCIRHRKGHNLSLPNKKYRRVVFLQIKKFKINTATSASTQTSCLAYNNRTRRGLVILK